MRAWMAVVCLLGCEQHAEWERNERCLGEGVSAHLLSVSRERTAGKIYRLGKHLGMDAPVDEMVVRVCNGSDRPIYVFRERSGLLDERHGDCEWLHGLGIRVESGRAVVMNQLQPTSSDWFTPPDAHLTWAEHTANGFLVCRTLPTD
jgi:hypothetical protein